MNESLYDLANSRNEQINSLGYNYEGKILRNTLSSYVYADPQRAAFLDNFESVLFFLVESVKLIRTYYNYTVPKNYRKIN